MHLRNKKIKKKIKFNSIRNKKKNLCNHLKGNITSPDAPWLEKIKFIFYKHLKLVEYIY